MAAAGAALVLVVVLASAIIRIGQQEVPPLGEAPLMALRVVHRTAASLEVLAMLALAWLLWRERTCARAIVRAAALAAAITVFLSILGIAAGQRPPVTAALGNLLGGLALAATFAWIAGRSGRSCAARAGKLANAAALLLLAQCLLGAWLAIGAQTLWSIALLVHATLGLALACGAAWFALRLDGAAQRFTLLGIALAAPAAGAASALFELPLAATVAHAAAVALLVVAAAYAHSRLA